MLTRSDRSAAGVSPPRPKTAIRLQARVTCPHCWQVFPPDQTLWIAQHPDLRGDAGLGPDEPRRFLPSRFTVDGAAIDSGGFACHALACPTCHLPLPRALVEMEPVFLSILGAPASGKSYFLAAMTWQLRSVLPRDFALAFSDADPGANLVLHEYEALQFLNPNQDELVMIRKTEEQGDLYDQVQFGDQPIRYPRPFLFALTPLESHPNHAAAARISRAVCLYDNAGESFLPGADKATSPVTRHLALSRALMFTFDPTQDPRFRQACRGKTRDTQMQERDARSARESPVRQETILLEAAARVRRYAGLGQNARHARPLVVIVTKYDCWSSLLDEMRLPPAWAPGTHPPLCDFDLDSVDRVSRLVRELLWKVSPELVSAAESFAEQVVYIPVSATGCNTEYDPATNNRGVRPRNIKPVWVEVPLLYSLARWTRGAIPARQIKPAKPGDSVDGVWTPPPPTRGPDPAWPPGKDGNR